MLRHPYRAAVSAVAAVLLVAGPAASAAIGSPVGSAQARAEALRAAVDDAELRAEQASEAYDETQDRLARLVTLHLGAERQLAAARTSSIDGGDDAARRVRAMYEAGGRAGLYSSVIDGTDLADVLMRYQVLRSLVATDARAVAADGSAVKRAEQLETRLAELTRQATDLERQGQHQAAMVAQQLARERALLASADAEVVRLAQAERAAAQVAAQRAFQARLLAAQQNATRRALTPHAEVAGSGDSSLAAAALALAKTQIGKPYLWGAQGPGAFDCSGLTSWAYAQAGHPIGRTSRQQWYDGPHVALADLAPGDLLFWATDTSDPATIHHVAIYAGAGMMLAAPHSGTFVQLQPVYLTGYIGAVRPAPATPASAPAVPGPVTVALSGSLGPLS